MDSVIRRLRTELGKAELDCALVTSLPNIRYLSGFTSDEAALFITDRSQYLFTDFRYTIQAEEQAPAFEVIDINGRPFADCIAGVLQNEKCKRCAFEESTMSVGAFRAYEKLPFAFEPWSAQFNALRIIKMAEELDRLQKAQAIADRAYAELLKRIRSGMTEKQVAAELNYIGACLDSEGPSFDTIVGSGPNGAMCHAIPSDRPLQNGDLVVVDFGCMYGGYHSDMTRTFGVGSVSDECRHIYDIVLEAHNRALNAVKPGINGRDLHMIAADYIAENGYGDCFGHGLGHGFGLEIHEMPRASVKSVSVLEPGMTITIEPGIYVEGLCGVRIEDCVAVTENGYLDFVSSPKELLVIE